MTSEDRRCRAVTVAGPGGPVDLVCPASATVLELAQAYAERSGLCVVPLLHDRTGVPLSIGSTLVELGIETGALLVATAGIVRHAPRPGTTYGGRSTSGRRRGPPGEETTPCRQHR